MRGSQQPMGPYQQKPRRGCKSWTDILNVNVYRCPSSGCADSTGVHCWMVVHDKGQSEGEEKKESGNGAEHGESLFGRLSRSAQKNTVQVTVTSRVGGLELRA
jgi:hypothetical protein